MICKCKDCPHNIVMGTPKSNEWRYKEMERAEKEFIEKFLKGQKPLKPEFSKTVDKHFWNLI